MLLNCEATLFLIYFNSLPVDAKKMPFQQQVIKLCGLGKEGFADMIENIRRVQLKFSRNFKEDEEVLWSSSTYNGFSCLDMGNRLFSYSNSDAVSIPFMDGMDPLGVLQNLVDQKGLRHLSENQVQFYELKVVNNKKR